MGRRQFETVVAQASKEKLRRVVVRNTAPLVFTTGFEEVIVFASPSTIARLVGFTFRAKPIGSGLTGTHQLYVSYQVPEGQVGVNANIDLTSGRATPDQWLQYQFSRWYSANSMVEPSTSSGADVGAILQNAQFDSEVGFRLGYFNNSNATTLGDHQREYLLTFVEREVRL